MSFYHPDMEAIDYEPSAALMDAILGYGDYDEDDLYYGSEDSADYPRDGGDSDSGGSDDSEHRLPADDLRNPKSFPSYADCSPFELYDRRDWNNKLLPPPRHWAFLAEIVEHMTVPVRNILTVKDKDGESIQLNTNFDLEAQFDVKVGSTIAILYAEKKYLSLGVYGLRLDHAKFVKIFPCDLETLLRINDDLDNETPVNSAKKCMGCGKEEDPDEATLLRCSRCLGVSYCGKVCQTAAWKRGHKRECKVFAAVIELKRSRNWGNKKPRQWVAVGEREEPSASSDDEDSGNELDDSLGNGPYHFRPEWKDTKPAVVQELQGTFAVTSGELLWGQVAPMLRGLMTRAHDFASTEDKAVGSGTILIQDYLYRAPAKVGLWKVARVNGYGETNTATDSWLAYHSSCDPLDLLLLARPIEWSTRSSNPRVSWVNRYDWGYHCSNAFAVARFLADIDPDSGWDAAYKRQRKLVDAGSYRRETDPDNGRWERLENYDSHNTFLVDAASGPEVFKLLARPSNLETHFEAAKSSSFFRSKEEKDAFGCHLAFIGKEWEFARLIFSEDDSPMFPGKKELIGFWYDQDNRYNDSEIDRGIKLQTPIIKDD